ncbi:GP179 protein, partial [Podilymbus podiceps]|nr:GP179 protein [Podilymbus podiceps]
AGLAEGIEAGSRSICPWDYVEVGQPRAKPAAGSTHPSSAGVRSGAAEKGGGEGVPGGRGALLRQEAIASQDDSGVVPGRQSLATALEKGSSQPEPPGPGGTERVPARSWSAGVALAAAGKAGGGTGRRVEVCPGETRADSSVKIEICPWEESEGEHWGLGRALGKGSSEGESQRPGGEQGMEKPPAKTPELPKAALEKAGSVEGRRAEVCPWETEEGGRTVRAEICPWDAEGAQPEQERQEGERRRLGNRWESPCSGEGAEQPGTGLAAKHTALPKTSSRKAGTIDSKKANICPWELEDEP